MSWMWTSNDSIIVKKNLQKLCTNLSILTLLIGKKNHLILKTDASNEYQSVVLKQKKEKFLQILQWKF